MHGLNDIEWSPVDYAQVNVLAKEVGMAMLDRLSWMTFKPEVIVDVGCGTGEVSALLQARYPSAKVMAIDNNQAMLDHAEEHFPALNYQLAEALSLPLPSQSVDLVFANFLLPWGGDMPALLREWRRVLRPQGVLMFSAFGPDTLKEYMAEVLPNRVDMHHLGDGLLHEGLADPVLDVDYYTMTYSSMEKLINELHITGMVAKTASLPDVFAPLEDGTWALTYEVVYAHAFAPDRGDTVSADEEGTVRVPLSRLRERLRSNKS